MELAVKRNAGALPVDFYEQPKSGSAPNLKPPEPAKNLEAPDVTDISETSENPEVVEAVSAAEYRHVRSPEIRRNNVMILMTVSAVFGAIGGAALALSKGAEAVISLDGTFGGIFLKRLAISAVFLAAEFVLGFFALGDWLVWAAPMCCGMGLAVRIASTGAWKLLPSAILTLAAVVLGAAVSANLSQMLMRLLRGGTVYLDSAPRRSYILAFLGFFAMVSAAALYEGAIIS